MTYKGLKKEQHMEPLATVIDGTVFLKEVPGFGFSAGNWPPEGKNAGKIAEYDDSRAYGYEHPCATLCAPCAHEATLSVMTGQEIKRPFVAYDDGDSWTEPILSENDPPEVDTPFHCDDCGAFIPTHLTETGEHYVRAFAEAFPDHPTTALYRERWPDLFKIIDAYLKEGKDE